MCICIYIHTRTYYLSIYLAIYIYISNYLSISLFIYVPIYLSIYLSLSPSLSFSLSLYIYICVYIHHNCTLWQGMKPNSSVQTCVGICMNVRKLWSISVGLRAIPGGWRECQVDGCTIADRRFQSHEPRHAFPPPVFGQPGLWIVYPMPFAMSQNSKLTSQDQSQSRTRDDARKHFRFYTSAADGHQYLPQPQHITCQSSCSET